MRLEGTYLNIINLMDEKLTVNKHHLIWRKIEAIPLKSERRQGYLLSGLCFSIVLQILA